MRISVPYTNPHCRLVALMAIEFPRLLAVYFETFGQTYNSS
jgi:hypothetical protein